MHHRTALIGVIKHVGGHAFSYALKRDGLEPTRPVPAADQHRALDEVLGALDPAELRIPDRITDLMAPAPMGWDAGWQWYVDPGAIESPGDTLFDPIDVAHRWAFEIVTRLLDPARMARTASLNARNGETPGPGEVMDRLIAATWERNTGEAADGHDAALIRAAQRSALDGLLDLAGNDQAVFSVRAAAEARLESLAEMLEPRRRESLADEDAAHRRMARADIERYFDGRDDPAISPASRTDPPAVAVTSGADDMSSNFVTHLSCGLTGRRAEAGQVQGLSDAGRPLLVHYDLDGIGRGVDRDEVAARGGGFWKWRELLPVSDWTAHSGTGRGRLAVDPADANARHRSGGQGRRAPAHRLVQGARPGAGRGHGT
jgi:hypothetical protein